MKSLRIKISLFLNYFVFAILLNSVGTVILQVQNNFAVSKPAASTLEIFKDFSIAITSFLVASFLVRIGYRKAMLIALAIVTIVIFIVPLVPSFTAIKLLFAATGISFALIKVSVFATIGLVTKNEKEHASFMNFLESFFMVGVLLGYFIFSYFVDEKNPTSTTWFNVYYLLGTLSSIAFLLLFFTPLSESALKMEAPKLLSQEFTDMLQLIVKSLVLVFIISVFLYVLIEQSIMSWLPTFNSQVIHLSNKLSIQMASILAASIALGRFIAGIVLRKFSWLPVLITCLILAAIMVLLAMPLTKNINPLVEINSITEVPLVGFIFPLIGLLLAPIYPAINSAILSSLPENKHASMSGLIVVFSALGGTTGSIITAYIFKNHGGQTAFYFSLVPIILLSFSLIYFSKQQQATTLKNID